MYKYTFVFEGTPQYLLGNINVYYADTVYEAVKLLILSINTIKKAHGEDPIDINVDSYIQEGGIRALMADINLLINPRVIKILNEVPIYTMSNIEDEVLHE